jgi:hypothetical protein
MSNHDPDFENLRRAALTMATKLLASLSDQQLKIVEKMARSGGRLILETGPMPDAKIARLVMVELEGRRLPLAVHQA